MTSGNTSRHFPPQDHGLRARSRREAARPPAQDDLRMPAALLFVSGAASLLLEVVWTRELHLVLGSTTLAISTVLVAYMFGLGVGGLLAGRIASRLRDGIAIYGRLECGIGLCALLVPTLFGLLSRLDRDALAGLDFWPAALARFAAVFVVLVVPTMMMGATLPVMVQATTRGGSRDVARRVGLLYGINTLGAVCGAFLATFVFFGAVGLRGSSLVAALLDFAVGLFAIKVLAAPHGERRTSLATETMPASEQSTAGRWSSAAVAGYGIVGFTALVYEVAWTRVLALVLGSSIYALATMLVTFLGGIALGSLLARRYGDRPRQPDAVFALGVALLGILSLAAMLLTPELPAFLVTLAFHLGLAPAASITASLLVSAALMLPSTLVLGALFPLLCRAVQRDGGELADVVGRVYFSNTIGSALGAFASGFVMLPLLGLQRTMAAAVAVDCLLALVLLLLPAESKSRARTMGAAALAATAVLALAFPPRWDLAHLTRGAYLNLPGDFDVGFEPLPLDWIDDEQLLFYRDGINATVSVHRGWGEKYLHINGKGEAGTGAAAMPTQVLAGQIPMLFGPKAENVLVIGLASGVTAGSAALHDPARLDIVELEPAVIEAASYFDDVNNRPLARASTRVIADDGRIFLGRSPAKYDVVISEPSNPWVSGSASLFTREFFHAARSALRPGGRLLQWLQLYAIQPPAFASILAAIRAEFPFVYGFSDRWGGNELFLLALDHPLTTGDLPKWDELAEPVRRDLERVGNFSTADLWSLLRVAPAAIDAMAAAAPTRNSDDNMFVELQTPLALNDPTVLGANWAKIPRLDPSVATVAGTDANMLGEVALSFATLRSDVAAASTLLALANGRGAVSAPALAAEAELAARASAGGAASALSMLDEAVAADPRAFSPRLQRARARYAAERYEEALADLEVALTVSPGELRARFLRLQVLTALGRFQEGDADADALMHSPMLQHDPQVRAYAAHTKAGLGRFEEGIRMLTEYLRWVPYSAVEWPVLAQMYQADGKPREAEVARRNAERAARNRVLVLHRQALQNERAGSMSGAIELLREALAEDPAYEPAKIELRRLGASAD